MRKIFMSGHGEDCDYRKGARKVKRKNSFFIIAVFLCIFITPSIAVAFSQNEDIVKKGEGTLSPARRIKIKIGLSNTDFQKAWFNSKVVVNEKEVSIEEFGLVPLKTIVMYDRYLKFFRVLLPYGKKLGTFRDLYDIYLAKKKPAPKWLLRKIGIFEQETFFVKPSVGIKKEIKPKTEEKIKISQFPPISPRLLEKQKKQAKIAEDPKELKKMEKLEKPEIRAERKIIKKHPFEARKLIAPKIKTKTETEILLERGIARSEISKILDLKNIINNNLAVKFSALEIYERFYKYDSGLKIRPYLDEDERGILLEKGDMTFFLKESGRITMSKDLNNFLSLLLGKPVYALVDFKTFSAGDLDKVKENILERHEKEMRLFYILDKVRRKRFRLDVLREDLRNMLYYEDFWTVVRSGWASRRKFGYEQASAKSIVEFLRNSVVRNSDIELSHEDFNKKVGDVLSENIDAVLLKAQRKFN